ATGAVVVVRVPAVPARRAGALDARALELVRAGEDRRCGGTSGGLRLRSGPRGRLGPRGGRTGSRRLLHGRARCLGSRGGGRRLGPGRSGRPSRTRVVRVAEARQLAAQALVVLRRPAHPLRSEEHTSELQSREKLVCRLLLEKKN